MIKVLKKLSLRSVLKADMNDPSLCCHLVSKSMYCSITGIWFLTSCMTKWISVCFLHLHQHIDLLKCNFSEYVQKKKRQTTKTCGSIISVGGEGSPQAERAGYLFCVGSQDAGSHRVKPALVREITTNKITEHTGLEANRGRDEIPDSQGQFITINSSINSSEAKQKMTGVILCSPWY